MLDGSKHSHCGLLPLKVPCLAAAFGNGRIASGDTHDVCPETEVDGVSMDGRDSEVCC